MNQEIKDLLTKAEGIKERMAVDRDALRDIIDDLESFYSDIETGIEEMGEGFRAITNGLDSVSRII